MNLKKIPTQFLFTTLLLLIFFGFTGIFKLFLVIILGYFSNQILRHFTNKKLQVPTNGLGSIVSKQQKKPNSFQKYSFEI